MQLYSLNVLNKQLEKNSISLGTKIMQVNNFTYQINTKLKIYDVMKNTKHMLQK